MKIAIDAHKFAHNQPTGTERYSSDIIRGLIAQRRSEDTFILYTPIKLPEDFGEGVVVRRIRHIPILKPYTHLGISLEMLLHPPDVLFVPAHELPLLTRKPSVVTIHDVAFRKHPEVYSRMGRLRQEWSTRRAVKRATGIVCISEQTRDDLIKLFGADAGKLRVIYPPIEPSRPLTVDLKERERILRSYRLKPAGYFLFIGRVETKKNIKRLIAAYNGARKAGMTSQRLVLAGRPGEGYEEIESLVKELHLTGEIVLTGYISEKEKSVLLQAASGLVLPSIYEGFGYPVLEAYQAKIPVIASRSSSLPEIAGRGALFFDPEDVEGLRDQLIVLGKGPKSAKVLIEAGQAELARFEPKRAVRDLYRFVREATLR